MTGEYASGREEPLRAALAHLQSALEILDRVNAPAQLGAYIDLARCQLLEVLEGSRPDGPKIDLAANDHRRH